MAAKHGQFTTVGGGWSSESYGWTCKALQLGQALGPVEDMPTPRSSPESEYRYTDRGSEAKRNEDVKENRCPLGMEGVTDQLVNTQEPLSSTRKAPWEALGHRPRGSQASEALVSASKENCTQCQTPARAKSQASGEEQETELEEAKNTERPGSSISGRTRQSVRDGHPRPIWSRFLQDVCRKVTVAMRPKEGHKRSPAALQGFPNSAGTTHILSSWSTRSWECKRNHEHLGPKADSAEFKSRLEVARKQAFDIFNSIEGEAQALDTIFSREERQRRRKRCHASFRSVGDCLELFINEERIMFSTVGPTVALEWRITGVIQNVCQWVRDALCGKRPGPRQQQSTSQNWRQRAQNCCSQLETTGARSPGSRRMGGPSSWRGREYSKSVRPPSTRRTRDPRRQMSDEAKLSRMQHVRWWLGVGANCLFYQRFTVITQLPVVVPDDNLV